jgi:quercetin dioxygenase-like cupin family protein
MKKINLYEAGELGDKGLNKLLVHDSPYFKIINFNFRAGQELPVHSHDIEGQLSLVIIAGEGDFLARMGPPSRPNRETCSSRTSLSPMARGPGPIYAS